MNDEIYRHGERTGTDQSNSDFFKEENKKILRSFWEKMHHEFFGEKNR